MKKSARENCSIRCTCEETQPVLKREEYIGEYVATKVTCGICGKFVTTYSGMTTAKVILANERWRRKGII